MAQFYIYIYKYFIYIYICDQTGQFNLFKV